MKSPAFQWYPKDFLSSHRVAMMSLCEEGAYMRALSFCWLHGFVPADTKQLCKMIGKNCSVKIAEVVKEMFVLMPGDETKLIHERLDEERRKQDEWREKSSIGGKRSAEIRAKKNNQNSTTLQPTLENGCNQSSTLQSAVSSLHSALDVNDDDIQQLEFFKSFENKLRHDEHFVETCRVSGKLSLTDFETAIKEFFEQKVAGLGYKNPDMQDEGNVRRNFMYWIPGWKFRNRKEKNRPTYGNNSTNKPNKKFGRISESDFTEFVNRKFD